MSMKKPALMLTVLSLLGLAACGTPAAQPAASPQPQTAAQQPAGAEPRVASLSIHLTNNLLALGITPAGSVLGGKAKDFLPHVADRLTDTKKLGVAAEPDMEALLALKPETIYADEAFAGKDLSSYEKIAKTEVISLDKGTWRDHLKLIGKSVHREAQAETFIADYEKQAEKVKALLRNKIGGGTAMAIRVSAKELRVMGMARPLGPLLFQDLGLKPAPGVEKIKKAYEVISQEVLPDYNPDAIFVIVNVEDDAKKVFEQLQSNPLWQGLKAVKSGQVYLIPEQPWLDYSALGSKMSLDEAEKMFSK
ncbi:Periplasmic binding protein [Paenibacillus mucilaginosus 3016]|uniref:Periplasmic binding protein n=1 Tax=Paenibacillus mucilaginosus 3016 TaxID=1116391 RepID=H6NKT4_9BACL|nr:ABC transporter substrate-binding protein [Paenibacillus mucilaginosus]AFC33221.1 Periplasmic binding protein [Paenibacillus mucilaginosus 3016]WFA21652.1 iron-hydroxamate ABC transporter substrate-binding protein [Paenibacillus mucilaginosus]